MSLFSKIGSALKKVGGVVSSVVNSVAKVVKSANIPIISNVAGVVDGILPDTKISDVIGKVAEQGVVKVDKVEQTIATEAAAQGIQLSDAQVAQYAKAMSKELASSTGATIDDKEAETKVGFMTKVMAFLKAKWYIVVGALALVGTLIFFMRRKKGGRGKRRR